MRPGRLYATAEALFISHVTNMLTTQLHVTVWKHLFYSKHSIVSFLQFVVSFHTFWRPPSSAISLDLTFIGVSDVFRSNRSTTATASWRSTPTVTFTLKSVKKNTERIRQKDNIAIIIMIIARFSQSRKNSPYFFTLRCAILSSHCWICSWLSRDKLSKSHKDLLKSKMIYSRLSITAARVLLCRVFGTSEQEAKKH